MMVTDKIRKCIDCGNDFTVTAGEQEFLATKGYTLPKRCKSCRKKAKDPRYYGLKETMSTSNATKSSTKGRDISRTSGDFKHIDASVSPETAAKRIKQEFERENEMLRRKSWKRRKGPSSK